MKDFIKKYMHNLNSVIVALAHIVVFVFLIAIIPLLICIFAPFSSVIKLILCSIYLLLVAIGVVTYFYGEL